jgi:hypothetical protein
MDTIGTKALEDTADITDIMATSDITVIKVTMKSQSSTDTTDIKLSRP